MKLFTVALLVFLTLLVVTFSEAARGVGGSRGGSIRGLTSRGRTRVGGSHSRISHSSRKGSASWSCRVSKYTPIKARTVGSPVIRSQTIYGSQLSTLKKFVRGYILAKYVLSKAPVYSNGYPMYRTFLSIPRERAIRVTYEKEELLDSNGTLCLGTNSTKRPLVKAVHQHIVSSKTVISYYKEEGTYAVNVDTVFLKDVTGQGFKARSRILYDTVIVRETNCTQVDSSMRGTMVTMYETNPKANGHDSLSVSAMLVVFLSLLLTS